MSNSGYCIQGCALDVLPGLEAGSVQTCVTSPPYWGLRDYGTGTWEGGDPECDHETPRSRGDDIRPGDKQGRSAGSRPNVAQECACGARRIDRQLGLESTPEEYVARMVAVFREVRRVLADDGTLWLNLGDSYAGGGGFAPDAPSNRAGSKQTTIGGSAKTTAATKTPPGLKPKDLVGIPWRVAFALQADGWYLRSDIIWAKPNPMPESVTDRPTKAHEYLFLLSKSERYYYDAEAIKTDVENGGQIRKGPIYGAPAETFGVAKKTGNMADDAVWTIPTRANARSVWTVSTQPYPDAHFAVFPPKLIEPCILAGSRTGDAVLDPFMGSGTTAQVAQNLGRRWLGIELNPDYIALQHARTAQQALAL